MGQGAIPWMMGRGRAQFTMAPFFFTPHSVCFFFLNSIRLSSGTMITSTAAVPDRFANCPKEYRNETDKKYTECTIGPDQDWCDLLTDMHRAKDFRKYFLALLPLGLTLLALVANGLLICLCARLLLRAPASAGKKRLALLLSRSTACVLALLTLLALLFGWYLHNIFNYVFAQLFLTMGIAQFLAMAGTNLVLSSLLYTAVLHPMFYKTRVSMGLCWSLIGLIWALAFGASVPFGLLGATLFYPQSAPISCPYDQCQWPVALCLVVVLSLAYLLAIGCHLAMLWRMHRRTRRVQPRVQSKGSAGDSVSLERNMRAMNRLSLNLLVFSLCKVPFLLISIVSLAKLDELRLLGLGPRDPCKTFRNGRLFFHVELLSSLAAIIWLIGMVLDPSIDICLDARFRHLCRRLVNFVKIRRSSCA